MEWLKNFNSDYAGAVQALTPFILGFISWFYYGVYKNSTQKEGDAVSIVSPIFWTVGDKYKILAVHKYKISDNSLGDYDHVSQNSRPDQWQQLIEIKKSFFRLKHEITAKNSDDILTVVISRNGTENWKTIYFNH